MQERGDPSPSTAGLQFLRGVWAGGCSTTVSEIAAWAAQSWERRHLWQGSAAPGSGPAFWGKSGCPLPPGKPRRGHITPLRKEDQGGMSTLAGTLEKQVAP